MFKQTRVARALAVLLSPLAAATVPMPAAAQETQRIEITGSAVRRIQAEGALPVQILRREEIERTGATSVSELIQSLPAMQNFTNEGSSVGGGGNGFSGASIHNLGETRTLVLLNGRRMATFAGQNITGSLAGIDLNTIPLAAIDRVEVLTDGASALYGADAVGGVVNFITRKDYTEGSIAAGYSAPQGGAREARVSLAKGFGNLATDGFNVMLGGNFEKRDKLASVDRDFAKTGVINFNLNGVPVSFFNGSPRGIPGNVTHTDGYLTSPYYAANGACPPQHVALQEGPAGSAPACYYDYVTQLEIYPERKRSAVFAQGSFKLGANHTAFVELLASSTQNTNRIAPPPGEILVGPTSPFWSSVLAVDPGATEPAVVPYRVADVGRRTQTDKSKAQHLVFGVEGSLVGWDYNGSFTSSTNKFDSSLGGGYVETGRFVDALDSGLVNPFVLPGNQSPEAQQALNDSRILGFWEGGKSTLQVAQARASRELAALPGGNLAVATGVNYAEEKYTKTASQIAQGIGGRRFGDDAAIVPYTAKRKLAGVFGELVAPIFKGFEATASLRWDKYSDFGNATTAKGSLRYQPTKELLFRGSVGTGFKAPTVPQTSATRQQFGVTSGNYNCATNPALQAEATSRGVDCPTGNVQYNVYAAGNGALQPEKSRQWTLGARFEPNEIVSVGADVWQVKLRNAIGQVDEATIFGDPTRFTRYFTSYTDPVTRQTLLAVFQPNENLGDLTQRGIDLDARVRVGTPIGRVTTQLTLTHMLKDSYQLEKGGEFLSSLGKFGPDGNVTFRWQGRFQASLDTGAFTHAATVNFKSGYKDQAYVEDDFAVFDPNTFTPYAYNGSVKKYATFDWQTQWKINKTFTLTGGVLNLFDQEPPRSLKSAGGGQQIGYDDRYYDPRGRTLYANIEVKF
jgi:iron complex outermembrane recepter protein